MPKKWTRALLLLAGFFCLALTPAAAESPPDPLKNPVLAKLGKDGGKFYYLGERSGINGWLVIKDKQVQMVYIPPDNQSVFLGALFDNDGNNVTVTQVKALIAKDKEVQEFFRETALKATGAPPAMTLAPPSAPETAEKPAAPGPRLIAALKGAAGVNLGAPAAPQLLMVMDVNCPHCQATWRTLRNLVFKNALQVRLIPIGAPNSDNERAGAQLLRSPGPLEAWDKYAAGDKTRLAGEADPARIAAMRANHELIDAWRIGSTPYILYEAKDGKVKVIQGEIQNIADVAKDIGL